MKRALFVLLLSATPVLAQSNIGLTQYPASTCTKPQPVDAAQPPAPPERANEIQAIAYNKKVDAYNAAMRATNALMTAFNACMQTYIANGNADMQRIQSALQAALANAK